MYPTIGHLINDLFGTDLSIGIPTFGMMMALSFLAAAYILTLELKRKEKAGLLKPVEKKVLQGAPASPMELILNGIFGFLLGYKLPYIFLNLQSCNENPQAMIISSDGYFIGGVIGAALLVWLKYREKEKLKSEKPEWKKIQLQPHELVGDITVVAAVGGLLGAKIFHFLEYPETIPLIFSDPIGSISAGLTFYGGLIVGALAVIYYARKNKINILHLIDAAAPALILAYGIGRIGCQLAGDGDWGIVNTAPQPGWLSFLPEWMWSFQYPHNVNEEGIPIPGCAGRYCYQLAEGVYPTPFYEIIMSFLIFGILWGIRKKIHIPGMLFSIYLIFNGIERFLIEKIRVNVAYDILGFNPTQAEIISSIMILLGIAGCVYFYRKFKDSNPKQPV